MAPFIAKAKSMVGLLASKVVPISIPEVVEGVGCTGEMGSKVKSMNIKKVMIVTDEILVSLGLLKPMLDSLDQAGVEYLLFDKVTPDPSVHTAVEGVRLYLEEGCKAIIAFGGGSPMDCAKLIGVLSTNPLKDPKSFMGTFSLTLSMASLPPLIAVPTTAGTGSEATIAAVISFPEEEKKYTVVDPKICPSVAFLDPALLEKLPPGITACTGVDALTHAVESYVGVWRNSTTSEYSLKATKAIFKHLRTCYANGSDMNARQELLKASFNAGVAFTRASVGYVHAIAHQFGALYHTPHGMANAMVLPYILDFYRAGCTDAFADLAIAAGFGSKGDSPDVLADQFVQGTKDLIRDLEIPGFVKGLSASRVAEIAERAINEAHGDTFQFSASPMQYLLDTGYPVPIYMTQQQCESIVAKFVDPSANSTSKL